MNKRLGPEYIATRAGPGNSRVAYLPAEKAINLANEVFGFNGWSSSIQNIQIDFVDENPTKGTISIGLSVVVRVTLRDGTYHEDTGYGGIENCKSKIAAFEKAKKEGTTDALKRALRNFGNVLGNCIYDKDYITKVSKVKAGTGKWDVNELYRHADFAPKKEEPDVKAATGTVPQAVQQLQQLQQQQAVPSLVAEESFDVNEFDEADFDDLSNPDEVILPPDTVQQGRNGPMQQPQNGRLPPQHQNQYQNQMTPSKPPQPRPDVQQHNSHIQNNNHNEQRQPPHLRPQQQQQPHPHPQANNGTDTNTHSSSPGLPSQHFPPPVPVPNNAPIGFFSAKAADKLDLLNNPAASVVAPKFNPYAESPSIRKTSGVDHSTSAALNKNTLKVEPPIIRDESPQPNGPQTSNSASRPGIKTANTTMGFSPIGAGRGAGGMTSAYRPPMKNNANSFTNGAGSNGNSPMYGANGGTTSGGSAVAAARTPLGGSDRVLTAAKRAPLGDLSNVPTTYSGGGAGGADGTDVKRQKIGPGLSGYGGQNPGAPG